MTAAREVEPAVPASARLEQPARRTALPHGSARLLALQRAAGNRAVAGALRGGQSMPGQPNGPVSTEATSDHHSGQEEIDGRTGERRGAVAAAPPPPPPPPQGSSNRTVRVQRTGLVDDLVAGATDVAGGVKKRIIGSVRDHAKSIPGYTLLTVVLGKDPITDAVVERNGAALINGFLDIVPGSEKIRGPLQESKAIEKAGAWFDAEVPKLGITWDYIKGIFDKVVGTLGAGDLLDIPGAVAKVVKIFSEPIDRLTKFGAGAVKTLLEFIVEGAMALAGGAGAQVMGIIKRAGAAFDRIVADPMGFLSNLIAAVKGGFLAFASNIGTHLKNGLISWLTGSLGGIIKIPAKFDLPGVLGMVMDFLGLTWTRVRGKLLKYIPEPILSKLEAAAGLIADLRKRGLAAITDRIAQFADGLVGTVMNGIKDWITNNIITQAITKLISFFNPAGAIVQAAIAIYNTVMFFIERGKQIAALAESVFDSIEAIASGAIGGAVTKVEQALGRAVPVLLGFLARLIGLGDIATPVKKVMTEVQAFIDKALDKAIDWVAGIAKKIAAALGFGKDKKKDDKPEEGLQPALKDAQGLLGTSGATEESVRTGLPGLRERHSLKKADLHPAAGAAGAFQILVQRTQADTTPVTLGGGALGHAKDAAGSPLIGRVGSFASLEGLQDKRSAQTPALALYREHVIPRQVVGLLGNALSGPGAPRQGAAYSAMITVLLYATGKARKDADDPSPTTVQKAIDDGKSKAPNGTESRRRLALLNHLEAYVDKLAETMAAAAHRASVADNSGAGGTARGTTSDPQPADGTISGAAGKQRDQIKAFLSDAVELGMVERDWPEDATAIATAIARRYQGGEPNTHGDYATDIPLGPRGGTGSGKAVLTITAEGWSIRARGAVGPRIAVTNRASAEASIGAEIERLRAEESSGASFTDEYRNRVVDAYVTVKKARPGAPQVDVATEVRDSRLPAANSLSAPGRTEPPAVSTIIDWARDRGVA